MVDVCLQLINVQSNSEFASHQLNRDTWSDDTVKTIIRGSFIFWQVRSCSSLCNTRSLALIDPQTNGMQHRGQKELGGLLQLEWCCR